MTRRHVALAAIVLAMLPACRDDQPASSTSQPTTTSTTRTEPNDTAATTAPTTELTDQLSTPSTDAPVTTTPQPVVSIEHQPGTGEYIGALDDIDNLTCQQADTGWEAFGTATNPTDTDADYRIYVSFLDNNGETLGLLETDLDRLAPGTSSEWSATLTSTPASLECVLRVERRVSTP